MIEIVFVLMALAMLFYYPVKAMRKDKQYKYVSQLDETEKVIELV